MIEKKAIQNRRYMQGFALEHTSTAVKIGEGTVDGFVLPAVEFDLIYDGSQQVLHDLYIIQDEEGNYDYRLVATYLSGDNLAIYDGDGNIFHRLMTVKTKPDGTYQGDFVFIEKFVSKEVDDHNETNPQNYTTGTV